MGADDVKSPETVQTKLLISRGAKAMLDKAAERTRLTRSLIVEGLIETYLEDNILHLRFAREKEAGKRKPKHDDTEDRSPC